MTKTLLNPPTESTFKIKDLLGLLLKSMDRKAIILRSEGTPFMGYHYRPSRSGAAHDVHIIGVEFVDLNTDKQGSPVIW